MTQGCRWQEKSFNVAVKNKVDIFCRCGNKTDGRYKYNGDYLCLECFSKIPSKGFSGIFNTHKDLAYSFTTDMFDRKPIEIRSREHFKKMLKRYGLADASIKECHQEADFRKRINNEDDTKRRKEFAKDICLRRHIKFNPRGQK